MSDLRYYGKYLKFEVPSRNLAGVLMGADCIVGDIYTIKFINEDGKAIAWLVNKFGKEIATFSERDSEELSLLFAREWKVRVMLAYLCFTDKEDPGSYWGKVAIIANDPAYDDELDAFAKHISAKLADGVRPKLSLGEQAVTQMLDAKGNWIPKATEPDPKLSKGSTMMKSRMKASEKAVEQGRAKNKGCYFISILFIVVVIVAIVFAVKGLFGL